MEITFSEAATDMIVLREYVQSDLDRLVSVGITLQNGWRDHLGEIGYWVAEDHWNKGIATLALRQMTDYGFTRGNLRKLYAAVLAPNTASMRVLEKCGYHHEATLKEEVQKGGIYFDTHQFARHRNLP